MNVSKPRSQPSDRQPLLLWNLWCKEYIGGGIYKWNVTNCYNGFAHRKRVMRCHFPQSMLFPENRYADTHQTWMISAENRLISPLLHERTILVFQHLIEIKNLWMIAILLKSSQRGHLQLSSTFFDEGSNFICVRPASQLYQPGSQSDIRCEPLLHRNFSINTFWAKTAFVLSISHRHWIWDKTFCMWDFSDSRLSVF